ncbi:MAG: hypothetical protein JRN06_01750 [Nitrososphaerota archaeon]|nr:hypothetical protein [Nitrososphaerota archaeon]MDG7023421.1 hypothetical protein [Nitrososphaerota archaeon]
MNPWLEILISSLEEGALITLIDIPVSLFIGVLLGTPGLGVLGFVLLLESVVLMLIGGAVEFGATPSAKRASALIRRKSFDWDAGEYKRIQARGAFYTLIGVMFFLESLTLALVTTIL